MGTIECDWLLACHMAANSWIMGSFSPAWMGLLTPDHLPPYNRDEACNVNTVTSWYNITLVYYSTAFYLLQKKLWKRHTTPMKYLKTLTGHSKK